MVTVSAGLRCSSTFRAARRVTVPSANSSPEQATMPTFFLGRSTIAASFAASGDMIHHPGNLLCQGAGQVFPTLVQLSNSLGLELPVAAVDFQNGKVLGDDPTAFTHHLGSTAQLAAIDRDGWIASH